MNFAEICREWSREKFPTQKIESFLEDWQPNQTDKWGDYLLDNFIKYRFPIPWVREILKRGESCNNVNKPYGRTAIFSDTNGSYLEILVEFGADINHQDSGGNTLLHYAVFMTPDAIAKALALGADPNIENNYGENSLYALHGLPEMLELLIAHTKNIDQFSSRDGMTALQMAVYSNIPDSVSLLLKAGADKHLKTAQTFNCEVTGNTIPENSTNLDILAQNEARLKEEYSGELSEDDEETFSYRQERHEEIRAMLED